MRSDTVETQTIELDEYGITHVEMPGSGDLILRGLGVPPGTTEISISYQDNSQFWGGLDIIHDKPHSVPKRKRDITWSLALKYDEPVGFPVGWYKVLTIDNPTREYQTISILGFAYKSPPHNRVEIT